MKEHMTLGDMIRKCKKIINENKGDSLENVSFDFADCFPVGIDSWRGVYAELALNYATSEDDTKEPMPMSDFLNMLEHSVGKVFEGYKGGSFVMDTSTPVWVANHGYVGGTYVSDILYDGYYSVIIETSWKKE